MTGRGKNQEKREKKTDEIYLNKNLGIYIKIRRLSRNGRLNETKIVYKSVSILYYSQWFYLFYCCNGDLSKFMKLNLNV